MAAILRITDGTTTVDLLDKYGFHLFAWRPIAPSWKDDGIWDDVASSDGRRLRHRTQANIIDSFELKMRATSQDVAATKMSNLRKLLERAAKYWLDDGNTIPVYLVRKSRDETNRSYATIYSGFVLDDENPFSSPFLQPSCYTVHDELELVIEHDLWRNVPPDILSNIPAGVVMATNESSATRYFFGNVYPTQDDTSPQFGRLLGSSNPGDVIVSNSEYTTNILATYTQKSGVWTDITFDQSAYLIGPGAASGDAVYFGFGPVGGGGPAEPGSVHNIVLTHAFFSGTHTYVVERWNGVTWGVAPSVLDGTNSLTERGVITIRHPVGTTLFPKDSLATAVPGAPATTEYKWIRIRKTNAGGEVQLLNTYMLYNANLPYLTVEDVGGDYPTLANIKMDNMAGIRSEAPPLGTSIHAVYLTAIPESRYSRNNVVPFSFGWQPFQDKFTPYINLSSSPANFSGFMDDYTVTPNASTAAFDDNDHSAPTGSLVVVDVDAGDGVNFYRRVKVTLDPRAYQGRYKAFLRYHATITAGVPQVDAHMRIGGSSNVDFYSETNVVQLNSVNGSHYITDLGNIVLPSFSNSKSYLFPPQFIDLDLYMVNNGTGALEVRAIDLVLFPIDIRSGFTSTLRSPTINGAGLRNGRSLLADSVYKNRTSAILRQAVSFTAPGTEYSLGMWIADTPTAFLLPNDEPYRIYFLAIDMTSYPVLHSYPYQTMSVSLKGARRYATAVGAG